MRKLWECNDWSEYVSDGCRKGIRLRFEKGIDPEVKRASMKFVNWLRTQYEFPMRVPIYFKASKTITAMDGEEVSATFFGPYDKTQEPYIRVSTGDYEDLLKKMDQNQDNALAAILRSIAHELSHYFQWLKDIDDFTDEKMDEKRERQALYYSREIIYDYADVTDHP